MKSKTLFIIFFAASLSLSAQIQKGTFMVEGGIKLGDNWRYDSMLFPEGFGISFGTHDEIGRNYSTGEEQFHWGTRSFAFSLSPRLGYSVFRNFMIGVDLKYIRKNSSLAPFKEDDKSFDRGKGYGFLLENTSEL